MSKRKCGRFYVSEDQVVHGAEDFAGMLAKMKFVPVRVEYLAYANQFEYIGISPMFEDTEMDMQIPEYVMECSYDQKGFVISVHGNRV